MRLRGDGAVCTALFEELCLFAAVFVWVGSDAAGVDGALEKTNGAPRHTDECLVSQRLSYIVDCQFLAVEAQDVKAQRLRAVKAPLELILEVVALTSW